MQKAMDGAPHETLARARRDQRPERDLAGQDVQGSDPSHAASCSPSSTAPPKGGVILGICDELKVPVRYVGLGERAEDLREFVADEFVEALFGQARKKRRSRVNRRRERVADFVVDIRNLRMI